MDNRLIFAAAVAAGAIVLARQLNDETRSLFGALEREAIALDQGLEVAATNAEKREAMLEQITAGGCIATDLVIAETTIFPGSRPGDCLQKGGTVGMIGADGKPAIIINTGDPQ